MARNGKNGKQKKRMKNKKVRKVVNKKHPEDESYFVMVEKPEAPRPEEKPVAVQAPVPEPVADEVQEVYDLDAPEPAVAKAPVKPSPAAEPVKAALQVVAKPENQPEGKRWEPNMSISVPNDEAFQRLSQAISVFDDADRDIVRQSAMGKPPATPTTGWFSCFETQKPVQEGFKDGEEEALEGTPVPDGLDVVPTSDYWGKFNAWQNSLTRVYYWLFIGGVAFVVLMLLLIPAWMSIGQGRDQEDMAEDAVVWKQAEENRETIETLIATARDANPYGFTVYENNDPSGDVICQNHQVRKYVLYGKEGELLNPKNYTASSGDGRMQSRRWDSVTCDICQKNVIKDFKDEDGKGFPEFAVYSCPCCKYWEQEPLEEHAREFRNWNGRGFTINGLDICGCCAQKSENIPAMRTLISEGLTKLPSPNKENNPYRIGESNSDKIKRNKILKWLTESKMYSNLQNFFWKIPYNCEGKLDNYVLPGAQLETMANRMPAYGGRARQTRPRRPTS